MWQIINLFQEDNKSEKSKIQVLTSIPATYSELKQRIITDVSISPVFTGEGSSRCILCGLLDVKCDI